MTEPSPLDGPPTDDLAYAFVLPDYVLADSNLAELYEVLVARLRREALGLPMGTLQQLLIERIAGLYVQVKHREAHAGFTTPNQQKEFNVYWLDLTKEFNKLLTASQDKLRDALLLEIQNIVQEAMELIPDLTVRQDVRRRLTSEFSAIEI